MTRHPSRMLAPRRRTPRPVRRAALYAASVWMLFMAASAPRWIDRYQLATRGQLTVGHVVRAQPEEHWSVLYTFEAGGKRFTGSGSARNGGLPPMEQIRPGTSVIVSYDPRNPANSDTGGPERDGLFHFAGFIMMATLASALTFAIVFVRSL